MSDTIRRLANNSAFSNFQSKINRLSEKFLFNAFSINLSKLCDLSNDLADFQTQIFNAIEEAAAKSGVHYDVSSLKRNLLAGVFDFSTDSNLAKLQEKDREIAQLDFLHRNDVSRLQTERNRALEELSTTRKKLGDCLEKLEQSKPEACGTMRTCEELILLRSELRQARDEVSRYKARLDRVGNYEREVRRLRDEVSLLLTEKELLEARVCRRSRSYSPPRRCYSPPPRSYSPVDYRPPRCPSPTRVELTNSIRHSRLVARFTDLYAINRLDVQDRLRRFVYDDDMVKRIIFIAVCEAFHAAKTAFRSFRLRTRRTLSPSHLGPCSLEEAVNDYIIRNLDLYDVDRSVDDVIRAMNVNPKISFPPECDFALLSSFIREVCRVAYEMQALAPELDIAHATQGELFNESRYRRNYDSEFSAPLVAVHIWPALMEGWCVLMKGECITRHGATYVPRYRRR